MLVLAGVVIVPGVTSSGFEVSTPLYATILAWAKSVFCQFERTKS